MQHCGARTRAGGTCRNAAMPNGRCRMHGGKSLSGPALPQWKDGRRSKVLPRRLMESYQASLADPDRLVLNEELALLDARINDVLVRVDSGESGQLWAQLRQTWREYEVARKARDPAVMAQSVTMLGELISRGHADAAAWAELRQLVQERRKLAESERKRLVEAQQVVAVDQALALLGLMVDAVQRHVHDAGTLGAIVEEYARLTGRPVPVEAPPALPARGVSRRAG